MAEKAKAWVRGQAVPGVLMAWAVVRLHNKILSRKKRKIACIKSKI